MIAVGSQISPLAVLHSPMSLCQRASSALHLLSAHLRETQEAAQRCRFIKLLRKFPESSLAEDLTFLMNKSFAVKTTVGQVGDCSLSNIKSIGS